MQSGSHGLGLIPGIVVCPLSFVNFVLLSLLFSCEPELDNNFFCSNVRQLFAWTSSAEHFLKGDGVTELVLPPGELL